MKLLCSERETAGRAILLSLLFLCFSTATRAQDLEPRSFYNLPVGETFLAAGWIRADGDVSPAPSSPLQDVDITIDIGLLGLAHTFSLAGSSAKLDVAVGRACYEGSATFRGEFAEDRRCENTDATAKLTWNFYGAPALSLSEYRKWNQGLVIGTSLTAVIPVGDYTSRQIINAGTNRWMLKPAVGLSWRTGRWQWEFKGAASFFEDNDDFFGGIKSEQDPLYALNAHAILDLRKGRWVSLDANYFWGGRGTKGGVRQDDRQDNSRFGVTFSMPISRKQSIKFYYSQGVATRVGNDFERYGISWLYRI